MPEHSRRSDDNVADDDLRRRGIAAGLAFGVVVASYGTAGLGNPDNRWAAAITLAVGVLLTDLLPAHRTRYRRVGMAPIGMIGVLVATWLCVPETNQLPIVAIVPGVLVALEFAVGRQAPVEWYAVAAVCIGWGGLFGASGRTSAFIGAMFAWWVLLLPIVVEAMRRRSTGRGDVVVMFIGVAAVILFARTGGIASDGTIAVLLLPVVAAASLLLGLAAASLTDRG